MLLGFYAILGLIASLAAVVVFLPLSPDPNCSLLKSYFNIAESMKIHDNCHIGVGYSSCTDINIDANLIFNMYKEKLNDTEIVPRNHQTLNSHQDFIETFLHFFEQGASSERVATNPQIILDIEKWINELDLDHYKDVGGHAPKFAKRITQEGWKVFFPGGFSNFESEAMANDGVKVHDWDGISELDNEPKDIHIWILYQAGEEYFGSKAIRSNRFYLIYDPKGQHLNYVEDYHNTLEIMNKDGLNVHKHMFAGYQYMEGTEKYKAKDRFKVISAEWKKMKEEDPNHSIHLELAHFNYHHTIHYMIKYLFNNTDSIGLNEQELISAINQFIFYKNKNETEMDEDEIGPAKSILTVYESLDLVHKLIHEHLEVHYPVISRVQYHTLGHMVTCYDPTVWENAEVSLFKSGLVSAQYCNLHNNVTQSLWDTYVISPLDLSELNSRFSIVPSNSSYVEADTFLQYVQINNSKFLWGVISTPKCRKPTKLTGLGDNISSTGFTYQNKLKL